MLSPKAVAIFNQAAELARAGKIQQALSMYESIINGTVIPKDELASMGELLGLVDLRRAYCLMDLRRYKEARDVLESRSMKKYLSQFDAETAYDYH